MFLIELSWSDTAWISSVVSDRITQTHFVAVYSTFCFSDNSE